MGSKIILALDDLRPPHMDAVISIAALLREHVHGFKLGEILNKLPFAAGCLAQRYPCSKTGVLPCVMVDRKFHNTPNVMEKEAAAFKSASIITVHASAGAEGIRAALRGAPNALIAAVTIMSSMSDEECLQIYRRTRKEAVTEFAEMAVSAGAGAVVCSGHDLRTLRQRPWMHNIKIITPGIRLSEDPLDDQIHIMAPGEAIYRGADYIVVGRSIMKFFGHDLPYQEACRRAIERLDEINRAVNHAHERLAFTD